MAHDHDRRTAAEPGPNREAGDADGASGTPGQDRSGARDPGDAPAKPGGDGNGRKPWYRRPLPAGIFIVVFIAVVVFVLLWWRNSRQYESTDDAYVDVVAQRVSPQVAGRVARVLVNDNEDVAAGQVLLEIDPADFQVRLRQAEAARAQAETQVAEAEAQRVIREADLDQAKAGAATAQTNAQNAAADLRRLQQARAGDPGVASIQDVEHAIAAQRSTESQFQAAQKAVAAAKAQLVFAAKQIDAAQAAVRSADAQVAQAQLTLSYAQVKASVAGRVADKTVSPGNYINPGDNLMAIVPRDVYVTADFKETQLDRIRAGQPVEVSVDAYPDRVLHAHVDSVQAASGSAFTPIPAQNAAGNWVKVVQRVPVKIDLDELPPKPARIGPGMSVEVKVAVTAGSQRKMRQKWRAQAERAARRNVRDGDGATAAGAAR